MWRDCYDSDGYGVNPCEVESPRTLRSITTPIAGRDLQLERVIEEVLRRMAIDPKTLPTRPDDPIKTKEAIRQYE